MKQPKATSCPCCAVPVRTETVSPYPTVTPVCEQERDTEGNILYRKLIWRCLRCDCVWADDEPSQIMQASDYEGIIEMFRRQRDSLIRIARRVINARAEMSGDDMKQAIADLKIVTNDIEEGFDG